MNILFLNLLKKNYLFKNFLIIKKIKIIYKSFNNNYNKE